MKRFLALAALLALSVVTCVGVATARPVFKPLPLEWRTNNNGTVDSASFKTVHTQTTYDTTKGFVIQGAVSEFLTQRAQTGSHAQVDSMTAFVFEISPKDGSTLTPSADSFLVVTDASMDGSNWVTLTPTQVFDGTRPAGSRGAYLVAPTNSNSVWMPIEVAFKVGGGLSVATGATPSDQQLFGFNFVRFIVQGCGSTGEFVGRLWRWVDE